MTTTHEGAAGGGNGEGPPPGVTVLLVDDHDDTLAVLTRLLRRAGYVVMAAQAAAQAVAIAGEGQCRVVVSDIGLPGTTGIELMRQLRASHPMPGIALSGYGDAETAERAPEAGFDAFLVKPVAIGPLLAELRRLVG